MNLSCDVIVVGAGPSGLSAGYILEQNNVNYRILEKGKLPQYRKRDDSRDIMSGVGGGGLFSDGKISFPPSGSWLWNNVNSNKLKVAYDNLRIIMKNCDIDILQYDSAWTNQKYEFSSSKEYEKKYESIVMSEYSQMCLLEYLYHFCKDNILSDCYVQKISKLYNGYSVFTSDNNMFFCKHVILAYGKFGYNNLIFDDMFECKIKNRIEAGIRVECNSEDFLPFNIENVDYKFIHKFNDFDQIRTFCCCKNGEVIESKFENITTFNSAKACVNKASIGVLIRSENRDSELFNEIFKFVNGNTSTFKVATSDFLSAKKTYIGKKCDELLRDLVESKIFDKSHGIEQSFIYGPEVEYTGSYFAIDRDLKIDLNTHVIGDASCEFRGLLPALISGIYVGLDLVSERKVVLESFVNNLGIKISNSEPLEMIFTAQSKNYFYCRDVICQYVLSQKKLPINPFRVFDYFLGDRVDRDLIRQGNNQLIVSCKELWVFGPIADGVLFEIALAKIKNKPIRFFTIGSTLNEIHEIRDWAELTFEPEVHSKQIKKEELIAFVSDQGINDRQFRMEW